MIDNIKSITMTICFLSILIAILEIISPNKKLKNIFSMFVNMFVLFIIISSVLNLFNLDYSKIYNNQQYEYKTKVKENEDIIFSIMDNEIEKSLKSNISSILLSHKINVNDVHIKFKRDDKNNLNIEEINLYLEKKDGKNAEKIIKEYIDTKINIFYT